MMVCILRVGLFLLLIMTIGKIATVRSAIRKVFNCKPPRLGDGRNRDRILSRDRCTCTLHQALRHPSAPTGQKRQLVEGPVQTRHTKAIGWPCLLDDVPSRIECGCEEKHEIPLYPSRLSTRKSHSLMQKLEVFPYFFKDRFIFWTRYNVAYK